jgi:hypothetical protein
MKISEKIKQIQSINIDSMLDESLKESEKEILDLAKGQLYDEGVIDVNNPGRREYYKPQTIAQKKRKAAYPKTEFITLRWMGDFYDKFKMIIFKDKFVITSDDLKWANYLEPNPRFENAIGLTEDSVKKVRDMVLPLILKRIKI